MGVSEGTINNILKNCRSAKIEENFDSQVVGQSILPSEKTEPGKQAKAAKVNMGPVARGDKLASKTLFNFTKNFFITRS